MAGRAAGDRAGLRSQGKREEAYRAGVGDWSWWGRLGLKVLLMGLLVLPLPSGPGCEASPIRPPRENTKRTFSFIHALMVSTIKKESSASL